MFFCIILIIKVNALPKSCVPTSFLSLLAKCGMGIQKVCFSVLTEMDIDKLE